MKNRNLARVLALVLVLCMGVMMLSAFAMCSCT